MASEQVKSVLDNTRSFHRCAKEMYSRLAKDCEEQRASMLLDYLSEHEARLEDAITQTEADVSAKVLNTWVQSSESSTHLIQCQELQATSQSKASFDDLVELALKLDDQVIAVYQDLAQRAEPAWLQDVFESLLEMEQAEEKQLAKQALRGMDL
ncbi:hypothetical protein [Bythopirellula goksoeyrii]|uniref:DUF2383 domain-containing protein n=1 Tax=Bythopirellula goksoeyrii TaxID=1400387 RepID=A0A5B9Q847_9BACT|nr:hypothetical protein [Bythopirellula goksoeyrii]QEG33900.1 hypothetical protein Pr1d_11700 [Bythopirellula goksoeyrii]